MAPNSIYTIKCSICEIDLPNSGDELKSNINNNFYEDKHRMKCCDSPICRHCSNKLFKLNNILTDIKGAGFSCPCKKCSYLWSWKGNETPLTTLVTSIKMPNAKNDRNDNSYYIKKIHKQVNYDCQQHQQQLRENIKETTNWYENHEPTIRNESSVAVTCLKHRADVVDKLKKQYYERPSFVL
ncbi:hypothetical protein GJ496_001009 [Pomphorhynchus laevis]|nr:hypothetical protein GJ496_001009 [Pomphorhynchus laevis]